MRDGKLVIRYFVSYAHKDQKLKDDLLEHLKERLAIAKDYYFEAWEDREILAGEKWHEQIQTAVARCQFGLLLVSPAFLGSPYIKDHELPAFVASNLTSSQPEKRAIPVALKSIPFDDSIDLKGLERLQIFRDRAGKAFQERAALKARDDFANELFQQILKIAKSFHDPVQLALLKGDTVLAVHLEEFKREVVKRASAKPAMQVKQAVIRPQVLLIVSDEDDSLGQTVAEVIDKHGMDYVMPLRTGKPAEIREDLEQRLLESNGVIIVYGAVTHTWARNQVQHYLKFMSLRQQRPKALAVYEGPPEEKEDLGVKLPGMRILKCRKGLDENQLCDFLSTLTAGTIA